ncbi:hypothetical protein ACU686_02290 [Yinghuangia aomiensis]
MADYQVDGNKLFHLSRLLEFGMGDVQRALGALKDVGPDALGHKSLDKACLHVEEKWSKLVTKLVDEAHDAMSGVLVSGKRYDNSDAAIRAELDAAAARAAEPGPALPPGTDIRTLPTKPGSTDLSHINDALG